MQVLVNMVVLQASPQGTRQDGIQLDVGRYTARCGTKVLQCV